jgi:hypothetical protein
MARFLIIAILLVVIGIGCGTTHHFLPPRPLEKKEWMLSVAWHYDFGRLTPPTIMPDFNAYVGIGKDYNFGLGAQTPYFMPCLSHLTLAKYYDAGDNNRWAVFSHINQVFGANNNPYLELGGSYIDDRGSFDHMMMFGLGYGHGDTHPLLLLLDRNIEGNKLLKHCRIMPFLKYAAIGSDVGFSLSHYFGLSRTAMSIYKDTDFYPNDTLYVIPANEIDSLIVDSISPRHDQHGPYSCEQLTKIYLRHGDSVVFCGNPVPWCGHAAIPFRELRYWLKNDYLVYKDALYRTAVMNSDSLVAGRERNDTLVIVNYPPEMMDQIDNINSLVSDNSIGLGIINYSKSKD